ncbi:transcription factor bHLH162-like [Neltuma alba]|uniref:transcription factor bHLH162-like n=1 Tax=Neltuma alba TaxID=207710 RepID=UPI0010A4DB4C|nr:transcription factor bHLH162-like [Prosopis alba]XP_028782552.1 transcription factor bHLH162-like [Prosopis alba]
MENVPGTSSRCDRKVIERNRRSQMRALYSRLSSLVPRQTSKELISLPDQLGEATNYIKKLQIKLEKMQEKKLSLMEINNEPDISVSGRLSYNNRGIIKGSKSPKVEIHQMGSTLEVCVITGLDCQFIFNEFIRILHEEQADILSASYSVVQDTVFHNIHCQVGECGNRAGRISERLRRFVYGSGAFEENGNGCTLWNSDELLYE